MKSHIMLFFLVISFSLKTGNLFAQGEAAVPFLLIDPSVKGQGMAGAMGSVTNDASAMFYNPACLVRSERFSGEINRLGWMPQFKFDDLNYYQTAATYHFPEYGWFGINFIYFDLGENIWTDERGTEMGTWDSDEWALTLGYAYKHSNSISLGINMKVFQSNLTDRNIIFGSETGDGKVTSYAFDIGFLQQNILSGYCYKKRILDERYTKWTLHRPPPGISLGITLSNIGPAITYIDKKQEDPIPQNLRLGLSWNYLDTDIIGLITSVDFNKLLVKKDDSGKADPFYKALFTSWSEGGLNSITTSIGQQISIMTVFAFRIGYFYEDPNYGGRKYISYGFSFGPETLSLNTAWTLDWRDDNQLVKDTFIIGLSLAY